MDLCWKCFLIMSLLFNMLSRFVIAVLPRSKHLLISWLQSPSAVILKPKKIKSVTISIVSPFICHEVLGPDARSSYFGCWVLSQLFHSPLSPSSRGSLIPLCLVIRMVSSAYLRLLIFLPAILISACDSSSPALHMIYSAYKLNKQGDHTVLMYSFPNLEPVCCSMSCSHCCFLTYIQVCRRQVRWSGIPISKNFPQNFHGKLMGEVEIVTDFIFLGSAAFKSLWMVTPAMKLKDVCSLKGKVWQT